MSGTPGDQSGATGVGRPSEWLGPCEWANEWCSILGGESGAIGFARLVSGLVGGTPWGQSSATGVGLGGRPRVG